MKKDEVADFLIDVSDCYCPSPLLKAKRILSRLLPGNTLRVSRVKLVELTDFEEWCLRTGHSVLSKENNFREDYTLIIKKG